MCKGWLENSSERCAVPAAPFAAARDRRSFCPHCLRPTAAREHRAQGGKQSAPGCCQASEVSQGWCPLLRRKREFGMIMSGFAKAEPSAQSSVEERPRLQVLGSHARPHRACEMALARPCSHLDLPLLAPRLTSFLRGF